VTSRADVRQEVYGGDLKQTLRTLLRTGAVRPIVRLGAIAAWTGGLFVVLVAGMWVTAPWPRRRLGWRNSIVGRWARGLGRIVNMRVTILGPRPKAPFFLVANHLSYCDIVLLLGHVPGVFVAKKELNEWPVIGYLTRLVGTIFVDRNSRRDAKRVLQAIDQRVASGDGVIVFPEGTSSSGGDVHPMRTALFEWAAQTGKPVA
jgi:1-acyl-sn-glycerol-3-phosphate acyltransferase